MSAVPRVRRLRRRLAIAIAGVAGAAYVSAAGLTEPPVPDPALHSHTHAGGTTALAAAAQTAEPGATLRVPSVDVGADTLKARGAAQLAAAKDYTPFHDFRFTDRVVESRIAFVHRIVDDAGLFYNPSHYDHGNGLAAADVDGDSIDDLYFVNQLGGNELWKGGGDGTFRNMTAEAGVALADRVSVAASFADADNDGDADLFVTTVRGGNALFENDGKGHFRDVSKAAGVDHVGHSSGAVFFDYDRDGLLDLYVSNVGRYTTEMRGRGGAFTAFADAFSGHLFPDRTERGILYRNLGKLRFQDVTSAVGLGPTGWNGDAGVADLNGDGYLDLYALNMQGGDRFFENVKGERFVDATAQHFPRTPWGSMGIKFFDADGDGRQDLLITDMHSDMSVQVSPDQEKRKASIQWNEAFLVGRLDQFIFGNALFHRLANGQFEERSDAAGVENYWPWGPSVGDLNADGWPDVFIASSMNFPFRYGVNSLLLNDRGQRFLDSEFVLGVEPRRDGRTDTPWFDVPCGVPGSPCQGRQGTMSVRAALGSRSSVFLDIDRDGDLDIVTSDLNSGPQVLVSSLAAQRAVRWLGVRLVGTRSNRDGLGAVVRVVAGGRTQTAWHDGKSGYLSQSAVPLYFGLGDASTIDRIEVDWPSGRRQRITAPTPNTIVRLTESE